MYECCFSSGFSDVFRSCDVGLNTVLVGSVFSGFSEGFRSCESIGFSGVKKYHTSHTRCFD